MKASLSEILVFYNVENLFRPEGKPAFKGHVPKSGLYNWNSYRYENKLFKIAHVIELMQEELHQKPAIIGLAEVQGKEVLEDLVKKPVFENYGIVHYESMDERGVDVALLYDATKVEILHSEPISYFFEIPDTHPQAFDTTRDVLYCKLKLQNEVCHVYVVHLPSKREHDVNRPKREYILGDLNRRILELQEKNNDSIFVMGDFNENPDAKELINLTLDKDFNKILTNPFKILYTNGIFSTFHNKDGLVFDQIMVSKNIINHELNLELQEANVFQHPKLASWERKFQGRPFRTYAGTRYLGGYSDHFPVYVRVNLKEAK